MPLGGDRFDRSDIIQVPGGPAPWGQVVRRDDSDDEVDLGSTVSAAGTRFHFGDFGHSDEDLHGLVLHGHCQHGATLGTKPFEQTQLPGCLCVYDCACRVLDLF